MYQFHNKFNKPLCLAPGAEGLSRPFGRAFRQWPRGEEVNWREEEAQEVADLCPQWSKGSWRDNLL